MLIGLAGLKWNGKTTAGRYLKEQHGFRHTKFAAPLKDMLRTMWMYAGYSREEAERRVEGDLKEAPDAILGGKTPVHAMQTLGTEWGRELIDGKLWTNLWESTARFSLEAGRSVVVDDVRFPNEYASVKNLGGYIILLSGRSDVVQSHVSEDLSWLKPDYHVVNDGTHEHMFKQIDDVVGEIKRNVWGTSKL